MELGIAEMNLFIMLSALGLSHSINGERLLPIGTLYDPFIARGLDALNCACYRDARFMVVATPSGITLAGEGGAHQSIAEPLIGIAQDGLASFEPAFVDELAAIMNWSFSYMQKDGKGEDLGAELVRWTRPAARFICGYQRDQSSRSTEQGHPKLRSDIVDGAYWLRKPGPNAPRSIVAYSGAIAPEAINAVGPVAEDRRDIGLLAVTSADRLNAGWSAGSARATAACSRALAHRAAAWRSAAALRHRRRGGRPSGNACTGWARCSAIVPRALGVEHFGQTGTLADLYRHYGIDSNAIIAAAQAIAPGKPIRFLKALP